MTGAQNSSALKAHTPPATMRTFYTDAEIFVDWCEKVGLEPFPASVATLCQLPGRAGPGPGAFDSPTQALLHPEGAQTSVPI